MNYLLEYIMELVKTPRGEEHIYNVINAEGTSQDTLVFRGQQGTHINKNKWFSTTKSKQVAIHEFVPKDGYLFIIHISNVNTLYINDYIGKHSHEDEQEVLVSGDGTFYADETYQTEGYKFIGDHTYECWYSKKTSTILTTPNIPLSAEYICSQIDREDMEFIDTVDDLAILFAFDVPNDILETAFKYINIGKNNDTN
jgi:hypothetical protein